MRRVMHRFISGALICLGSATLALSQAAPQFECKKETDPFFSYCSDVNQFLNDAAANKTADGKVDRSNAQVKSDLRAFVFVDSDPTRFAALLAPRLALQAAADALPKSPDTSKASIAALSGVNQNRPDMQTSPNSNVSGTTALVEKAGAPAILAFALESGALTRSVNGNTATLSGNADGLIRALTGQQVLCFECPNSLGTPLLRDVNLSAAFQINQNSASSAATAGPANPSTPSSIANIVLPTTVGKLSSLTARYQFWNPFDPHSAKFRQAWTNTATKNKEKITAAAKDLQENLQTFLVDNPINTDQKLTALLQTYASAFYDDADAANLNKLRQDFLDLYNASASARTNNDPEFSKKLSGVALSLAQYKNLWLQLLEEAKGKPLLTFEYTYNRPISQPETHDFRWIFGYSPKGNGSLSAPGLVSINAAVSIYGGTIPAGAKYGRLHDGQISAEYDRPITIAGNPNQATFSLAAYWQYQPDPSVLNITADNLAPGTNIQLPGNAQVLLGTSGSLWVTQAKVTINAKSGIKVPIAVKWSNKTDLLSGNKVGAQVGISYDFSSLSSLFGGSGSP